MWGCSYLSNFSGMPVTLTLSLMAGLGVAVLILLLIRRRRSTSAGRDVPRDRADSMEILSIRYARGEVGESEYRRMKKILNQPGK